MSKIRARLAAFALAGAAITATTVGVAGTASAEGVTPACDITWTFGCGVQQSVTTTPASGTASHAHYITSVGVAHGSVTPKDLTWTLD